MKMKKKEMAVVFICRIKLLAIFNVSQALKATQLGFVFY